MSYPEWPEGDYRRRVVDEKIELDDKLLKLKQFFQSDVFRSLNQNEMQLLSQQCDAMQQYTNILAVRIAGFTRAD